MNQNMIRTLIFDMDGVIADSEPLHCQVEHTILKERKIDAPWDEWEQFTGMPEQTIFQYIIDHFTDGQYSADELIRAKYDLFMKVLTTHLQPVQGALDFIRWAKQRYGTLALTTSSGREVQEKVFDVFDLSPYFDVIVTGEHIQHGKPHPEPYLRTVELLGVPVQNCLVLEDSLNGIQSAKAAGCRTVGITTTFSRERLQGAGADLVVQNYPALQAYLCERQRTVIMECP